jgi:hypothetical protein
VGAQSIPDRFDDLVCTTLPILGEYKGLKPLFNTGCILPTSSTRDIMSRKMSLLFSDLPFEVKQPLLDISGAFYRAVGCKRSIQKSIDKMDVPKCKDYKNHPYWPLAKKLVNDKLHEIWVHSGASSSELVMHRLNLDTSAGYPLNLLGIKKKRGFFERADCRSFLYSEQLLTTQPIWRLVPKTEWKDFESLRAQKVRTFVIPPVHLVYWCIIIYYVQNLLLKQYWWSAYGFNPYMGGVHTMADNLNRHRRKLCYDVSGWDRVLPILQTVYNMRQQYVSDSYLPHALWVERNTVSSRVLLPNGDVVERDCGNNSGSGNTTSDNIVSHMYILALALLIIYEGDVKKVLECIAYLFGDDNICALVETILSDDEIIASFKSTYALFGLALDPFIISDSITDLNFLGFEFVCIGGKWLPKYDLGRLASSFCYEIDAHDEDAEVGKAYSLMVMSTGHGETIYNKFKLALEHIVARSKCKNAVLLNEFGVPGFWQSFAFCTGAEFTSCTFSLFDYSVVGGIKSDYEF